VKKGHGYDVIASMEAIPERKGSEEIERCEHSAGSSSQPHHPWTRRSEDEGFGRYELGRPKKGLLHSITGLLQSNKENAYKP